MESDNILLRLARATRLVPPVAEEGFRPSLKLLAASSVAINLIALTIPIVMLITMDRILPFRAIDTLVLLMAGAVLALLTDAVLRTLRSQLTAWSAAAFEHATSVAIASRLLAQPIFAFEGAGSGKHLDQFRKVGMLRQYFSGQSFTGWIDLPFSVLYVAIVAVLSWPLALVMVIGFGAFTWYSRRMAVEQHVPASERMQADQRRNNFLIEILANIHTLKSMAMEALMLRRYDRLAESSAKAVEKQARVIDDSTSLAGLLGPMIGTLVTAVGAWEVINGDLSRGELSAVIFLSLRSLSPLQRVGLLWAKHHSDEVIGNEIGEVLEQPALPSPDATSASLAADRPALEIAGLGFGDDADGSGKGMIDAVSFTLSQGQTLLLRGENGSGRSTLLGLIAGTFSPKHGSVRLFGQDVTTIDRSRLTELVGYLPQRAVMYDGTLLQNATMFRAELADKAREVANYLGFAEFIMALPQGWETRVGDSAAERLPPGLRQRIGIIRALVTDPPIILFDDATAAVDAEGEAAVIRFLEQAKGHKAIIIVSHRPSLMKLADSEFVLESAAPAIADQRDGSKSLTIAPTGALSRPASEFSLLGPVSSETDTTFWNRLDTAVAGAFRETNELSVLIAPLLREIGWRGAARDVIEALPYYEQQLDITGLSNALSRLGFRVTERHGDIETIDDRGYPCLVLPETGPAVLLLEKRIDGYTVCDNLEQTSVRHEAFGNGRALFFERDSDAGNAATANWTRAAVNRLRPVLLQAALLSTLIGVLLLANALFTTLVFSEVLPTGARDTLLYALIGVLVSFGLVYFLQKYRAGLLAFVAGRVEYLFGTAALGKLMQLSPSYTERSAVGAQIARLSGFDAIRDIFTSPIGATILELPATVVIAIVLCLINPVALPIIIVMLVLYALMYWLLEPVMRERVAAQGRQSSRRNEFLVEMIGKMRGIRESRAEQIWLDRYRVLSADASFAAFRTEQLSAALTSAANLLMMIAGLAIVAFSIPQAIEGKLGAGALVASLILVWRVLGPMQTAFTNLSRVDRIRTAAQQFDMVMQLKGERLPAELRASMQQPRGAIEFSRVSFRYSITADPALIGVTLDIQPGDMLAMTGVNGGGKSTFLKLLLGMYAPQAGTIRIDGVDIRQIDPVDLRRMVGYVPQEMQFFRATIAQNLRFGRPEATDEEVWEAVELAGARAQVQALPEGLNYRIGDSASERLPASMRQKLALARAYLTRAPILIFDEPGTGLDYESDACFIETLKALKGKRTVIFISHRPSHMKLADNVALFRNGYLEGMATPENLFPQSPR